MTSRGNNQVLEQKPWRDPMILVDLTINLLLIFMVVKSVLFHSSQKSRWLFAHIPVKILQRTSLGKPEDWSCFNRRLR